MMCGDPMKHGEEKTKTKTVILGESVKIITR